MLVPMAADTGGCRVRRDAARKFDGADADPDGYGPVVARRSAG